MFVSELAQEAFSVIANQTSSNKSGSDQGHSKRSDHDAYAQSRAAE